MQTVSKTMVILTILCAILSATCVIVNFAAGSYWLAVLWMTIFGFDAWDAWRHLGMWIDHRKTLKQS